MKRLRTGVFVAMIIAGLGLNAVAASNQANPGNTGHRVADVPPANFGAPPSGQIPILYNDRHVYTKPDILKQARVLAALVKNGTILIPLRSMFEQMGASVSYDAASKTVDVSKAGADVKVTVGKPEVVINGETRPLDVPPMMYQGVLLVPVRVISEGMGAYVLWVPDRHLVVVRYIPATPPPPPTAPPATPTPAPAATPYHDLFIAGDYIFNPKVYNEFSPGNTGKSGSYAFRGAFEFNLFNLPWMLEGDYRQWVYPHLGDNGCAPTPTPVPTVSIPPPPTIGEMAGPQAITPQAVTCAGGFVPTTNCSLAPPAGIMGSQGCVTVIGVPGAQTFVPAFTVRDYDFDGRLGLKIANPRIYIGVGYIWRSGNYGYPRQQGFGYGLEKLPDLDQPFSVYGSVWYYPNMKGTCPTSVCPTGPYVLAYNFLKYSVGGTILFGKQGPIFLDLGWMGDRGQNKQNAPIDFTHNGGYVGLGIRF